MQDCLGRGVNQAVSTELGLTDEDDPIGQIDVAAIGYRDALRMLILFTTARLQKKPAVLALEDLDRDLVLAILDELEEKRNNSVATRNAQLAAIRSFFHHVAATDPASFGVAQRVLTIHTKRAHIEVTHHLSCAEVDAIVAVP